MAYATSGGGNIQALVNAIRDFAVGLGWTNAGSGTNSRGGYQFLQKGICNVAMEWITTGTYFTYTTSGGAGSNIADHRLRAFTGSGINASRTTYYGHPGYPNGTVEYSGSLTSVRPTLCGVETNNLTGPLSAWHLFSNATGDYIHVAVNTNADFWSHFSFGLVDKGAMTHSGAAYVAGATNYYARDNNNADPGYSPLNYNKPSSQRPIFSDVYTQLYIPDALPVESGFTTIAMPSFGWPSTAGSCVHYPLAFRDGPSYFPSNDGLGAALLDHVAGASAPTWSGQVPLYGIPSIIRRNDDGKIITVGMYPDVRYVNMTGLLPGQEITLSGTTWKVFPIMRQEPWSSSRTLFVATSGQYGVAYKKT
jgi:hypothetical protein